MRRLVSCALLLTALIINGCESARLPVEAGTGPDPQLPQPNSSLIPTVVVAPAKGWPPGRVPTAASGLEVTQFAAGLDHPRWLYVLPNGDVLVAETNAQPKKKTGGIKGWFKRLFMKRAGAAVPSADRISLLRDGDGDGVAETATVFRDGLTSPFGMALVENDLYIANTDALLRFRYESGATELAGSPEKIVDLPAGEINGHWTRNVVANGDGSLLYVSVGSDSNIAEHGIERETNRAAILEVDPRAKSFRVYASGLRNPVGMDWEPQTRALWTVVNERDELGSDLVPDYLTSVTPGGFYGWPYSYYGQTVDERVKPQRPDLVARALEPDYALGPHTASLGLTFYEGTLFPERYRGGAFIGQHGSWNRRPRSGYKVIYVPFESGRPAGMPVDILTGFVSDDGNAYGRPVGVTVDRTGALLVADDVGNVIWRITPSGDGAAED